MDIEFMIVRPELDIEIFKLPSNQTTRLTDGIWCQDVEFVVERSEAK